MVLLLEDDIWTRNATVKASCFESTSWQKSWLEKTEHCPSRLRKKLTLLTAACVWRWASILTPRLLPTLTINAA